MLPNKRNQNGIISKRESHCLSYRGSHCSPIPPNRLANHLPLIHPVDIIIFILYFPFFYLYFLKISKNYAKFRNYIFPFTLFPLFTHHCKVTIRTAVLSDAKRVCPFHHHVFETSQRNGVSFTRQVRSNSATEFARQQHSHY